MDLCFTSEIFLFGINPCIIVPTSILGGLFKQSGKHNGHIPVRGIINGVQFKQTVVKYSGEWRLYINGIMCKEAEVGVGDKVKIEIEFDPKPRTEPMNKKFSIELNKNKKAKEAFAILSPSRKKEVLRYLNSMKSEESLDRNVIKVIQHLLGEKPKGLYALMHRKKE